VPNLPQSAGFFLPGFLISFGFIENMGINAEAHTWMLIQTCSKSLCPCSRGAARRAIPVQAPLASPADAAFSLRFAAALAAEILPHPGLFCRSLNSLLKARALLVTLKLPSPLSF